LLFGAHVWTETGCIENHGEGLKAQLSNDTDHKNEPCTSQRGIQYFSRVRKSARDSAKQMT
jgi:hypothetical protein